MTPRILPVPEGKQRLGGIGTTKFYELMKSGEITRVKIGNRAFVTVESLDRYIDKITEAATA